MNIKNIPLESFIPKGKVSINIENKILNMITTASINDLYQFTATPIKSFIELPEKIKIPFSIDMKIKINSPSFYFIIGKGHIGFGTGNDNRRITDILGENLKPNTHEFDNHIPINKPVDILVTYTKKAMWVLIDGEYRCFSKKDSYIKAIKNNTIPDEFENGFGVALACDKRTVLSLEKFIITEYELSEEPPVPVKIPVIIPKPAFVDTKLKSSFDDCIQGLSDELQEEIKRTDIFLLKEMKKNMKFKRKIEGGFPNSKITYVSPYGLSYRIFISFNYLWHSIGWTDYNTKREQEKYDGIKKCDYTIEMLEKLSESSREFADEMFLRIKECTNCYGKEGQFGCMHTKKYEYNGMKDVSCGGRLHFKMFPTDFVDLKKVVIAINEVFKSLF